MNVREDDFQLRVRAFSEGLEASDWIHVYAPCGEPGWICPESAGEDEETDS
jgi:hypothetical protein